MLLFCSVWWARIRGKERAVHIESVCLSIIHVTCPLVSQSYYWTNPFIHWPSICLFVFLFVCLCIHPSIYLFIYPYRLDLFQWLKHYWTGQILKLVFSFQVNLLWYVTTSHITHTHTHTRTYTPVTLHHLYLNNITSYTPLD